MQVRTHNGVPFRILNVIDAYSCECLAVRVARKLTHHDVLDVLTKLSILRGVAVHMRSDNGSEFTAKRVRSWLSNPHIKHSSFEPGSPWENGFIDSFNGKMRDELLNGDIFYTLILIKMWRKEYNTVRPHSTLGYGPPVPTAIMVPTTQFQLVGLT